MQDKDGNNLGAAVNGVGTGSSEANREDERGGYTLAQRITGLKRGTLQSRVCLKQIPHTRLGKRLVVFSRAELEAWMSERAVPVKAVP